MRIKKTYHYITEHEKDVPWEVVLEVIRTTKGKGVGPNLIRYIRRSKRRETISCVVKTEKAICAKIKKR
ncbi:MAG: hypothetical protein ACE5MB_02855 [Anaerolineae bacterium]